jgi:DNA-binding NarL/FixJ family response regulator
MPSRQAPRPIRLALVNDYEIVLVGVAHMFDLYQDRVAIAEIDLNRPVSDDVDIALYDNFAQPDADDDIQALIDSPHARRVVGYTWNFDEHLIETALAKGASGYLSKTLAASELVDALERIHRGEIVVSPAPSKMRLSVGQDWPGRSEGLSERESEILALITQGKSNSEVAALTHLSMNSIKTYIRSMYRKIGVTRRTREALLLVLILSAPPMLASLIMIYFVPCSCWA